MAFRDRLWEALDNVGFLIPPETYRVQRSQAAQRGRAEYLQLRQLVGGWTWRRALETLPRPCTSDDCTRILGFGYALAQFCLPPLRIDAATREQVLQLGALVNFLVAVYDQMLDLGVAEPSVLPRTYLRHAARGGGGFRPSREWFFARPRTRLLAKLVHHYYHDLSALPFAKAHPAVKIMIQKAVLSMYDSEVSLAMPVSKAPYELALRRKAALPFVVMGSLAWLSVPECLGRVRRRHLRWLYRVGDFIGWIDDAVDLYEDWKAGHPNRVAGLLEETGPVDLARSIAMKGIRVVVERDTWFEADAAPNEVASNALALVVVSWFGGPAYSDRRGSLDDDGAPIMDSRAMQLEEKQVHRQA